jgi:hypothetical protein
MVARPPKGMITAARPMPRNSQPSNAYLFGGLWDRPGYLLRRAYQRKLAVFEEECAQYPITPVQYAMLTMLNDVGRLDAISLINAAGAADQSSGASDLRRLQTLALVEQDRPRLDRGARRLTLSEAGRRRRDGLRRGYRARSPSVRDWCGLGRL